MEQASNNTLIDKMYQYGVGNVNGGLDFEVKVLSRYSTLESKNTS